jgi:hypothetical protein
MVSIREVRSKLRKAHKRLKSWKLVGQEFEITKAMAFRIAEQNYEPKDVRIRLVLGLAAYAPAPVCPIHKIVHTGHCPRQRQYKDLYDMPTELLRWKLEHRETWPASEPLAIRAVEQELAYA